MYFEFVYGVSADTKGKTPRIGVTPIPRNSYLQKTRYSIAKNNLGRFPQNILTY
jgi:hypothetical protein